MSECKDSKDINNLSEIGKEILRLLTDKKPKIFPYVKSFKDYENLRSRLSSCYYIRPIIYEHLWNNCWEIKTKSENIKTESVRELVKNEHSLDNHLKSKSTTSLFD